MKVSTNSIGNYNPVIANKNNITPTIKTEKSAEALKVSTEEKKFFTKLYPDEKDQINNYHFYNKDGDKNGVSLGSLFDRRG